MQPSRLSLDAGSATASKEWRHWLKTFDYNIEVLDSPLKKGYQTDRLKARQIVHHIMCINISRNVQLMIQQLQL